MFFHMLLELEKRRGPRALLLRRPPRHATPRHDAPRVAGLSRAELTPTRLFLPVTNGEFSDSWATISDVGSWAVTDSDVGRAHVSPRGCAYISVRCLLTLAATNRSHLLTRTPTVVPLLLLPPVTPSRLPRTRSTGEQVSETTPFWFLYKVRGE